VTDIYKEDILKAIRMTKIHPDAIYLHPAVIAQLEELKHSPHYPLTDEEKGLHTVRDLRVRMQVKKKP
jgi:hypothetical protein